MIKLVCNNQLLYKTISSFLLYKKLQLSSLNKNYQIVIEIQDSEKSINLIINGHKTEILFPIDINILNSKILKKIIEINFSINDYKYFPYQSVIRNQKKKSFLSDIQNLIISNLITSHEGVDKDHLYNVIWKRDKSIYINKLDTHLTNLKRKLDQELNLKISFQSNNKKLRLLID